MRQRSMSVLIEEACEIGLVDLARFADLKKKSGEHAVFNLDKHLFYETTTCVRAQHLQR